MIDFLLAALDFVLHLDKHLAELVADYGAWTYFILFMIVYCETGLVVTPFLPGDSLLFAVGALAATGVLNVGLAFVLLLVAAILGDATNYYVGSKFGDRLVARHPRWLKPQYLERTHAFYEKYGGKTVIIARFVPIVRTFAPFVAGLGKMTYRTFQMYNVVGALLWVTSLLFGGYLFGNIPWVRENFGMVVIAIIVISILPAVVEVFLRLRATRAAKRA
jgi:membrane-associated protein